MERFDAVTAFASRRERAMLHIRRSVSRDVFEGDLMMVCEYFVRSYVGTALAGKRISPQDKKTIPDYYKCVCFGLAIDWLNGGMAEEDIRSIRRSLLLKKDMAEGHAALLQDQV